MAEYQAVIGLEVHAQLLTRSKLFCGCAVRVGAEPNSNVCPVCLGLPGALPAPNEHAIELGVRAALALSCTVHATSVFARKHYFYPDLPKGYQISQFEEPFATEGKLEFSLESGEKQVARIVRIHFEEDAGKNLHGVGGQSLVDLNRTGTPLIEIVGAPDLHSSAAAAAYLRTLREILMFAGVNDGNLEEGSFRCDANVSLRPVGSERLGTRTELKNINSFRYVQRAIDAEIVRQRTLLDRGERVRQETRAFDPDTGQTRTLRSKEDAHDYRYFPEPDLPPLGLSTGFVEARRAELMGLPEAIRQRMAGQGLAAGAVQTLTQHPSYVRFFDAVVARGIEPVRAGNWIQTEVLRDTTTDGLTARFPATPEQVAELLGLVEQGAIGLPQAKRAYAALVGTSRSAAAVVQELGLSVIGDDGSLEPLCRQVLADNAKNVAAYRAGKVALLGFFVGQVMKQTGGRANPQRVGDLLRALLDAGQ